MTGIRNGTNLNHYRYASLPHKGINLVRCLRNVLRIGRQAATSSLIFPHLFFSLVRRTCFRSERSSLPRLSLRDISRPLKQTCPPGWRLRRSAMMNSQFAQAYIAFYRRQPMRMWLSLSWAGPVSRYTVVSCAAVMYAKETPRHRASHTSQTGT